MKYETIAIETFPTVIGEIGINSALRIANADGYALVSTAIYVSKLDTPKIVLFFQRPLSDPDEQPIFSDPKPKEIKLDHV